VSWDESNEILIGLNFARRCARSAATTGFAGAGTALALGGFGFGGVEVCAAAVGCARENGKAKMESSKKAVAKN
jgi:hypothetical protein